jgi:sulfite exporter TauE/SafE
VSADVTLLSALLVGLFGSAHCLGMCGGIATLFSLGASPAAASGARPQVTMLLAYNAGRITSYTAAGVIAGALGATLAGLLEPGVARRVAMTISALLVLALGLYVGGWWSFLTHLERVGARAWRHIEPLGRKFIPVRSHGQAVALGVVGGWLPCGLVYTALAWSLASGDAWRGGALMTAFGLGTLPTLLVVGAAGSTLRRFRDKRSVRHAAGALLMIVGFLGLWNAAAVTGNHSHAHGALTFPGVQGA